MRLKVLLVDDEELARARLRTLLIASQSPTASVEAEAANATQALEWLRRQSFDLALIAALVVAMLWLFKVRWRVAS